MPTRGVCVVPTSVTGLVTRLRTLIKGKHHKGITERPGYRALKAQFANRTKSNKLVWHWSFLVEMSRAHPHILERVKSVVRGALAHKTHRTTHRGKTTYHKCAKLY